MDVVADVGVFAEEQAGFTCAWAACIIGMAVLWLLKITPRRKPRWDYFAFGVAFLVLFLSGLSRQVSNPIIGEIAVGAMYDGTEGIIQDCTVANP